MGGEGKKSKIFVSLFYVRKKEKDKRRIKNEVQTWDSFRVTDFCNYQMEKLCLLHTDKFIKYKNFSEVNLSEKKLSLLLNQQITVNPGPSEYWKLR